MAGLALASRRDVGLAATELFELFGSREGASWLFDAACDSVGPGSPVTLTVPLGPDGRSPMQVLGRISRCVPGSLIEIAHDQPWRGTLRIQLRATSAVSTRVTVTADLDEGGLAWIMRQRGWPEAASRDPSVHRVGLITSKTGPGAVYTVGCEYLAQLAVEELNADGGLQGRPVELMIADDGTEPHVAAFEARRLIAVGCRAIIASVTSESFEAIHLAAGRVGVPLIHPHVNEGGGAGNVFRWGERPLNQVRAVANMTMQSASGRRWFLVGNTYSWAYGAHRAGARAIAEAGGLVVGQRRVPLGTTDFVDVIDEVERSGADCVLSCLVGADEVAYERQVWETGRRQHWQTLSLAMEESTCERVGEAAEGIWAAMGYFEALDTAENRRLLRRYREAFGAWAPPISSFSESMYESFLLYAAAVRSSPRDDTSAVVAALHTARARMPRGLVRGHGPDSLGQDLYVARATAKGFDIVTG